MVGIVEGRDEVDQSKRALVGIVKVGCRRDGLCGSVEVLTYLPTQRRRDLKVREVCLSSHVPDESGLPDHPQVKRCLTVGLRFYSCITRPILLGDGCHCTGCVLPASPLHQELTEKRRYMQPKRRHQKRRRR